MNTPNTLIVHLDKVYYLIEYFPSLLSCAFPLAVLRGESRPTEAFLNALFPGRFIAALVKKEQNLYCCVPVFGSHRCGRVRDFAIMGGMRPCNNEVPRRGQRITK